MHNMKGKYCCGFQALCSTWATATPLLLRSYLVLVHCIIMATRKGSNTAVYIANYLKDNASSDEEQGEVETFEFANFEPFMALFRPYRLELSEAEQ